MNPQLNKELSKAVSNRDQLDVVDPATGRRFVIMERSAFDLAQSAVTLQAIQDGYDSIAVGEGLPVAEAEAQLRGELGFPPRA